MCPRTSLSISLQSAPLSLMGAWGTAASVGAYGFAATLPLVRTLDLVQLVAKVPHIKSNMGNAPPAGIHPATVPPLFVC
jgi:hypothetical protein